MGGANSAMTNLSGKVGEVSFILMLQAQCLVESYIGSLPVFWDHIVTRWVGSLMLYGLVKAQHKASIL